MIYSQNSNVTSLTNEVGNTDISSVGSTVTGAIVNLNGKVKGWTNLGTKTGKVAITYDLTDYTELCAAIEIYAAGRATIVIPKSDLKATSSLYTSWGGCYIQVNTSQAIIYQIVVNGADQSANSKLTIYAR